jgi:ribosomal protein S13
VTEVDNLKEQRKILLAAMKRCTNSTALPNICRKVIFEAVEKCKELEKQQKNSVPEIVQQEIKIVIGTRVQIKTDRSMTFETTKFDKAFNTWDLKVISGNKLPLGDIMPNVPANWLTTIIE